MTSRLGVLLTAGLLLSPQAGDAQDPRHDPYRFSVGLLGVTVEDDRCDNHSGISAGAEARTGAPWFVTVGADLLAGSGMTCITPAKLVVYEGQEVEVPLEPDLGPAPRIRLGAGHLIDAGLIGIELRAGAGLMYVDDGEGRVFAGWYGGSAGLQWEDLPIGLEFEYGLREVPIRYKKDREVVHEFGRWQPLIRFAVIL